MIRSFYIVFAFFGSKKIRMRRIARKCVQMASGLSMISCGISETGAFMIDDVNDVWTPPSSGGSTVSPSTVYVTAVDYPEGYDWLDNPEKGSVRCSLVVFADFRPVMKIPVGDHYLVSDDPDMHRVIDGHLYTDFASETETVIKKDGKELLAYQGRESVIDMLVLGDSLHTLGQKRNGKGFSYRVNGRAVLERDSGYAFARLTEVGGDVCFAFAEPVVSSEARVERYYYHRNGSVTQTALREDVKKVWDIAFHEGRVYYLASLTGVQDPVLISETGVNALPMPYGTSPVSGQIFFYRNIAGVEMTIDSDTGLSNAIWIQSRFLSKFDPDLTMVSLYSGDDGLAFILNSRSATGSGSVFRISENITLPEGYSCMGGSAADMVDGILVVGLSSLKGGNPMLWKDGFTEILDVNGCICAVSSVGR